MNTETLEALLIDHALGELSSETRDLLAAYLADHPEHTARAAAVESTAGLARRMLSSSVKPMSAMPAPPWRSRSTFPALFRAEYLRLAACLALGLAVGWAVRPESPLTLRSSADVAASQFQASRTIALPDPAQTFWSLSGASHHTGIKPTRYSVRWDSPVRMPHLEEKP